MASPATAGPRSYLTYDMTTHVSYVQNIYDNNLYDVRLVYHIKIVSISYHEEICIANNNTRFIAASFPIGPEFTDEKRGDRKERGSRDE